MRSNITTQNLLYSCNKNELFFEADLLLGLDYFLRKDFKESEKYFERLNKTSRYNLFFDQFVGNVLLAWNKASQGEKDNSFNYLAKIPKRYRHLEKIQNGFLRCYFDTNDTHNFYQAIYLSLLYCNFLHLQFFYINFELLDIHQNV